MDRGIRPRRYPRGVPELRTELAAIEAHEHDRLPGLLDSLGTALLNHSQPT